MLNYEFPPIGGGGGHAHLCLLNAFCTSEALTVDVLTSGLDAGVHQERLNERITIHRVGIRKKALHRWTRAEVLEWLWKANRSYQALLQQNTYDLVHAFFAFPSGWLCYRTRHRLPYVISLRGSDVPGLNTRLGWDYKLLGPTVFKPIWRHARQIVACSEGLRERAQRFIPDVSMAVIPNGVNHQRFFPAKTTLPESGILKLLTVGRLSVTKRVEMLIDVVEMLQQQGIPVTLTVVGSGGQEAELRGYVEQKQLGKAVIFWGRVESDEMPDVYRDHHVFISASLQEGMSNAMLEAMASGLPLVTTRCEGVQELIKDNGVVVDTQDVDGLCQAVQHLWQHPERRKQMAQASRTHALQFNWSGAAEHYCACYRDVLS
jgi:L-malate glycosyltransferase